MTVCVCFMHGGVMCPCSSAAVEVLVESTCCFCLQSSAFSSCRRLAPHQGVKTPPERFGPWEAACFHQFGSETWTPYQRHKRTLEAFHIRCLRRIPSVSQNDRVSYIDI